MKLAAVLLAVLLVATAAAQARDTSVGFADRLTSTFGHWHRRPTSEAQAIGMGFTGHADVGCIDGLGWA